MRLPWARLREAFRGYLGAVLLALVLALGIRAFVVQAFKIPSESMYPTILVGDHLLVNKFLYGLRVPFTDSRILALSEVRRGDVVVFPYPPDPSVDFIKRVVAVAGDVVEVRGKHLFIGGRQAPDPHAFLAEGTVAAFPPERDNFGPFTVPPGTVFVMGDNRDNSRDSRFWGAVPVSTIRGKAMFIYWSADLSKPVLSWLRWPALYHPRWSRIGTAVR